MEGILTLTISTIAGIALVIAVALLSALPIWLAWNAVIPTLFGLPVITFTQALYLSILASSLFKPTVPGKSDIKEAIKDAFKESK